MKALITGCQGFIGKNLAQHLKKQGHYVVGIDKKLKVGDPVFVDEFIGHDMESRITIDNDFERVYHLSADVPNSKQVGSAQLTTGRSNPIQTIQAMDFAAQNNSHFIYAVSAMIYNTDYQGHNGPDLNEDEHIWPAQPAGNIYGMEKLYNMQLAQEYAKSYHMRISLPIFHAMYGPHCDIFYNSKVVAATCLKILQADDPGEIEIWGDGSQIRSFCYIDDAIEMTHRLINTVDNQIVNVGNPVETTIEFVAKAILNILEIDPERLEIRPGRVGSALRRLPDTKQVQSLTGFNTYTPLETGLKQTIESLL